MTSRDPKQGNRQEICGLLCCVFGALWTGNPEVYQQLPATLLTKQSIGKLFAFLIVDNKSNVGNRRTSVASFSNVKLVSEQTADCLLFERQMPSPGGRGLPGRWAAVSPQPLAAWQLTRWRFRFLSGSSGHPAATTRAERPASGTHGGRTHHGRTPGSGSGHRDNRLWREVL